MNKVQQARDGGVTMTGLGNRETDRRNPLINCEYVPLPMRIVGADGITVCINHHFTKLMRSAPGIPLSWEDCLNAPCHLLLGSVVACPGCAMAEPVVNVNEVRVRETQIPHLPGRSFRVYTQPVPSADGGVFAVMEVIMEVTEKNNMLELFNVLSDPIYLVDVDTGVFLEANDTACRQLGYSREELLTLHLKDIDPQTDFLTLVERIEQSNPLLLETVNCDSRGACIPVEVHVSQIYHQGRKALLGVSRNIAERQETERLRVEARRREKTILDNIPFAAWMKDREGRYVAVNKMFLEQSGFSEKEVLEKSDLDLWPRDEAMRFWRQTEAIMLTGEPSTVEEVLTTRRGVFEVALIRRPLLDDAGEITGVVGVAQDIAERKRTEAAIRESEELYRTFLQRSSEAILVMDATNWTIFEANDKLLAMTGYTLAEVIDTPVQRYVLEDAVSVQNNLIMLEEGTALAPEIKHVRHKNGRTVPVERTAALIVYRGRRMILVTLRDLSEERRLQEQIQADVQLAGKMQRMLLPPDYNNSRLTIRTAFEPHRLVSGDYFDYRWSENQKSLQGFVLDITGHGMGTVLQAVSAGGRLGEMMDRGQALSVSVLEELDREISRYFPEDSFAAVLVFELNLARWQLTVGTGGINWFLASSPCYNGLVELPGSYVGMGMVQEFSMMMLAVQPGDCFYFLSDGLYERINESLLPDLDDFTATTEWLRKLARETCRHDDSSGLFIRVDGGPDLPLRFAFSTRGEWQIIRRRLRRILAGINGQGDRIDVAMNEAVNNALEHGGGCCRLLMRLRQGQSRQYLRVCVHNEGPGFDGNGRINLWNRGGNAAPWDESGEPPERGWGIRLMASLMDRVWYNESGTEVRMIKVL
ncbi:MAG TPA: PAS domain S-box protein [Patescibacteria group bacterium]|nr:PAS domain S-box protein [Patescibacteria group bacterium]